MSKQFDSSNHLRIHFPSKKMHIKRQNLGVVVGFVSSSSINGLDEMLGCESLSLSHVCLIEDVVLRFCRVAPDEETLHNA